MMILHIKKRNILLELSEKKSQAQFHLLLKAARKVLTGMFGSGYPADRELAGFYRENRQCGSRDRALINNALYILLRHWGWVRKLAGKELVSVIESGENNYTNRDLGAMFFFALATDNTHPAALKLAANFIELPPPEIKASSAVSRAAEAAKALGIEMTFSTDELLPQWTKGLVPADYAEKILRRPPMWLRVNSGCSEEVSAELLAAQIEYDILENFPDAWCLPPSAIHVPTLESFKNGAFEIQDLASQAIVKFCAPGKGERWFDPCAGAGGKTLAIAEAMGRTGTVVAGDIREKVLLELRKRARRSGYPNIQIHQHDGKARRGLKPFDGVLIDAPCSCSGVWQRNPGNPWILTPQAVRKHAELQLTILKNFAGCVKAGGKVIYATCSAFAEENEEVVNAFLSSDDRFVLRESINPLTGEKCSGFMHVPENYNCDLMFAALLERKK